MAATTAALQAQLASLESQVAHIMSVLATQTGQIISLSGMLVNIGSVSVFADGFAKGIHGPSTFYSTTGTYSGTTLGSLFARGATGSLPMTVSGGSVTMAADGRHLVEGLNQPASGTRTATISATDTDGTVLTKTISIVTAQYALSLSDNVIFDTQSGTGFGNFGYVGTGGTVAFVGNSNFTVDQYNYVYVAYSPLTSHYGEYDLTVTAGNGVSQPTPVFIVAEQPPTIKAAFNPTIYAAQHIPPTGSQDAFFASSPQLPVFSIGQLSGFSDTNFANVSATGITGLWLDQLSGAYLLNQAPTAGAYTITTTATSVNGKTSTRTDSVTIAAGGTLPSSSLSSTLVSGIDNSMLNVTVATLTASGYSGTPSWYVYAPADEMQLLNTFAGAPQPRYSIVGSGANVSLVATCCSAQSDSVVVGYFDSTGKYVEQTLTITATAKSGPAVSIGPTGTYPYFYNAAEAYVASPSASYGMVITMQQMDYGPASGNSAHGFGTTQLSAGNAGHAWYGFPGPITLQGVSSSSRTLLDLKGAMPQGSAQAGLYAFSSAIGGDVTLQNFHIRNGTEGQVGGPGEPNGSGLFFGANTSNNITVYGVTVAGFDDGIQGGDVGYHMTLSYSMVLACGDTGTGLDHNCYFSGGSQLTISYFSSLGTYGDYEIKIRSARSALSHVTFAQGQNGTGKCPMDYPSGGIHTLTSAVLHSGPNISSTTQAMIQFGEEIGNANPFQTPIWAGNSLTINGAYFLNTTPTQVALYGKYAVMIGGTIVDGNGTGKFYLKYGPLFSFVTGKPAQIIVENSYFYGIPHANRFGIVGYSSGDVTQIMDGGGNTDLNTWPGTSVLNSNDPLTGAPLPANLKPSNTSAVQAGFVTPRINVQPTDTQMLYVAAGASSGTAVTCDQITNAFFQAFADVKNYSAAAPYDVPLTNCTWTVGQCFLVTTSGSPGTSVTCPFAVTAGGTSNTQGAVTVSGTVANGLYNWQVGVTGTNAAGASVTIPPRWVNTIGGNGAMASA